MLILKFTLHLEQSHISCEDRETSRDLSYWENAVLRAALMLSYLGCCEQFGCLSCQKAAEKQKGAQERKHKCWQVDVPGEIFG